MKKFLIVLLVIILAISLGMFGLYKFSPTFKDMANDFLRYAPGPIGENFKKISTSREIEDQLQKVAEYVVELDVKRAVDKISLVEKEDKELYDKLIDKCLRLNPKKTQAILTEKRNASLSGNVLLQTLTGIDEEAKELYKVRAEAITKLSDPSAVSFIQDILRDDISAYDVVAGIFDNLDEARVLRIMKHLSEKDIEKIYAKLPSNKVSSLKEQSKSNLSRMNDLSRDALLIASQKPSDAIKRIGAVGEYSMNDLVVIYTQLGPKKAGSILALSTDDKFIKDLFTEIRNYMILTKNVDKYSDDLLKSMNIYKEYADNMKSLIAIYNKSDDKKIAAIVNNLYWKSEGKKVYKLDNNEVITISDKDIAIDLIKSFEVKKIASILANLDNTLATQISTELALPNPK